MIFKTLGYEVSIGEWNPSKPPWDLTQWGIHATTATKCGRYWTKEVRIGPWHIVISRLWCDVT